VTTTASGAVALDDQLGVRLPDGDAGSVSRVAAAVESAAERLLVVARGVARLLPVAGWSGLAAAAADERLLDVAAALSAERTRAERAAEALRGCAARLRVAQELADEARLLLSAAHREQAAADARDPALAAARVAGQWSGARADGTLYDPAAVALLRRAQDRAQESRRTADSATRRLVDELTALSGRRVIRETGSWSTVLDLVGLLPGYGDALDLGRAGLDVLRGDFRDAAVTGAASVPGPVGWLAGAHKVDRATDAVGDTVKVVDDGTAQSRAVNLLSSVPTPGRRPWTRLLADDEEMDRFFSDVLAPLGETTQKMTAAGIVTITQLPGGGRIVHRTFSRSGGHTIEIQAVDNAPVRLLHTVKG
jgi:hypothetical protein